MLLDCAGKSLDLSTPKVMGVLNITPDSFSDGGRWLSLDAAIRQAEMMQEAGAAIIDVGGESTRPGAPAVDLEAEKERVLPIIEALASRLQVPISVDTSKPAVMRAAVNAGAGLVNDVMALQAESALDVAAELGCPVCLMHMQGSPRTMQANPSYTDVVADVQRFLLQRAEAAIAAGVAAKNILLDPGFGFGKTVAHNYQLLAQLERLVGQYPLLVGMSRKSMLGAVTGHPVDKRLHAGIAAATIASLKGAAIIRTHDVAETVDAITICNATLEGV